MQGIVQANETYWCQGGLVLSKMFMRGRPMAERTTKAFQRQDQRIYKLPGPLIKKQVPKVLSPKGKQESQGPFSRCILIIPEDPRWVFQPCSASNTLPKMYNYEAEMELENVQSIPPMVHFTNETRNPPDRNTGTQWDEATKWGQGWRTQLQILTALAELDTSALVPSFICKKGDNKNPIFSECCED